MDRLVNALKRHASAMDTHAGRARVGVVQNVDPTNYLARVMVQPDGVLTGWLPICALAIGNLKIAMPPTPGDQVWVESQEGDSDSYIAVLPMYSTVDVPPTSPVTNNPAQPGEVLILQKTGSYLHLLNDGTWHMKGDVFVDGTITSTTGNIVAAQHNVIAHENVIAQTQNIIAQQGDIIDRFGSVEKLRVNYNAHTHPDETGFVGSTTNPDNPA